ncbi:MAG: hypothetical protein AB7G93_16075 [Bdellovibrionales bacterium]
MKKGVLLILVAFGACTAGAEFKNFACLGDRLSFWLDVKDGRLMLVSGPNAVSFSDIESDPAPTPMGRQETWSYKSPAGTEVIISSEICSDNVTDNDYPYSLTYVVSGRKWYGCCSPWAPHVFSDFHELDPAAP